MSEQSLKRYSPCLDWRLGGNCYPGAMPEQNGDYMRAEDVHALIDTLHAIESARGCDAGCPALSICKVCGGDQKKPNHERINFHYSHDWQPSSCTCDHGRMMAVLQGARS